MKKTILFLGARGATCQVMRIEEAFSRSFDDFSVISSLNDGLVPDFIFCNDHGYYAEAFRIKDAYFGKPFVICNVLDLFSHNKSDQADKWREDIGRNIRKSDLVTTIASYCVQEIKDLYGIDASLIYNPMIPVPRDDSKAYRFTSSVSPVYWKFVFSGRNLDPNRRVIQGINGLLSMGFREGNFVSFGSEHVGFGEFLGVISEEAMAKVYNQSHFLLFPSYYSGLGLPVVEAISAGVIPLCCSDMTTLPDILPPDLFPEYYKYDYSKPNASVEENISSLLLSLYNHTDNKNKDFYFIRDRLKVHYENALSKQYTPQAVAYNIYNLIKSV